jgi:hypothetical protein
VTGERTTTLRLRSVRFKNGGEVRLLRPKVDVSVRESFDRTVERAKGLGRPEEMAGFAIVTWSRDGRAFVNFQNGSASPIMAGQVSSYVRDVLLAETGARWAEPNTEAPPPDAS